MTPRKQKFLFLEQVRTLIVLIFKKKRFQVSIDGHNMTIIEADGVETDPLTVDSFAIFASQRYSVVLTADQPIDNYCWSCPVFPIE